MTIREVLKAGLSRIETVNTRTVLNPLLWVLGFSLPLLLGSAILIPNEVVQLTLIGLGGVLILLTVAAYFVTLFKDPERLQSEEYRVRQHAIQLLRRSGTAKDIIEVVNQMPRSRIDKEQQR